MAMTARDSWTLMRISGVPVRIHFTWIFVAAYVALVLSRQFWALADAAHLRDTSVLLPPWIWGILLTLTLFACVVLHELAHVAVARRGGAKIRSITLMMLGGVSEIGDVERPRLERAMAIAGPLTSLALALLFYLLFRASHLGASPDIQFGLFYLAQANFLLGVFNLLPAFPMDGGRILRSLLVDRFGRLRATQISTTVGKIIAVGLFVLGLFGGWWLALIGVFIFIAGDAEYRSLQADAALRGLRVGDLYARKVATIAPDASIADAVAAMLQAKTDVCFVVVDGRVIGTISAVTLARIPARERAAMAAGSLMQKAQLATLDDDLPAVLRTLNEQQLDAAAVIDAGQLVGTLTVADVARGLRVRELAVSRS
jgi:Zn-dependent protease/CBS domain-containing protein